MQNISSKLNELPVFGHQQVSLIANRIANLWGLAQEETIEVEEMFVSDSLREAENVAYATLSTLNLFKRCGNAWQQMASGNPSWDRVGPFLVCSYPKYTLFGLGPREPVSMIVRIDRSSWKQYSLILFS